jgi:hypothetical protein
MKRRALLILLAIAAAALVAVESARADGQLFVVTGTGDGAGACGPYPDVPGAFACTTLRAAVAAAGTNDTVGLPGGTYTLSQGELAITKSLTILGHNARDTTIQGSGSARVVNVAAGVSSSLIDVTISGGQAGSADGGNILNAGSLLLLSSRVTAGQAINGGGIANTGTLLVTSSLIDHNTASLDGGGIASFGGAPGLQVKVYESTVYKNSASTAGGISSLGETGTQVDLLHATVAFNTSGQDPAGIRVSGQWTSYGSLVVGNQGDTPANCNVAATSAGDDIESGTSCGFQGNSNAGLVDGFADDGGPTPILPIPANSAAKGFVNPCQSSNDQRSAPRNASGACDAGAYEQGAVAPPVVGFQLPTPAATPTPTPTATPVAGKSVAGTVVEGKVLVKTPGGKFVALDPTKPIPLGSTIDTKNGTIQLTAQQKKNGKTQTAKFFDGIFKITQTKTTTDLTLNEALAKCPKRKHAAHASAKKKPKSRKLWGNGSGSFRTRGQYSAATVRGTEWLVQDSCSGTLTRVKKGVVAVRDNVRRKTIVLRAGKHYLAKPRR